MAQGIILAAGYSSRAQTNKMLLIYKGKFLISHAIEGMLPFVSHIFVVTGHYHLEIQDALKNIPHVTIVQNERYGEGMFSSVLSGVSQTSDDFFILPGDCPFVSSSTYEKLLLTSKTLGVPTYLGNTGHPLFLKAVMKSALLEEPRSSNLKMFRNRQDYELVKTNDPNILTDIDTPADYQSLHTTLGKDKKYGS